MERVDNIYIGLPYRLELVFEDETLDASSIMASIFIQSQDKRYEAEVSNKADEPGVMVAYWSAEQTNSMVTTTPVLEVYYMVDGKADEMLLRVDGFTGTKRVSVSSGVKHMQ